MGGAIGTSLLTTFLARQNQQHQFSFASHTFSDAFNRMRAGFTAMFQSQGFDPVTAGEKALRMAEQIFIAQSNALSFKNSFWIMSIVVACLIPLPFIMRRPRMGEQRAQAAH